MQEFERKIAVVTDLLQRALALAEELNETLVAKAIQQALDEALMAPIKRQRFDVD